MKYGYIICLLFILIGCRSSKSGNIQRTIVTETEKENTIARTDSTRSESSYKDSTTTTNNILEYSRTTTYGDDGRVSSLQEQWRRIGSTGLSVSSGRTSEISITEEKIDSSAVISEQLQEKIVEKTVVDSRLIQGTDCIYVISILTICFLIAYILYKRQKK